MGDPHTTPPPFTSPFDHKSCTYREHVVSKYGDEREDVLTIAEDDPRRFRCDCGLLMIGNGHVEIRFGLLPHLFPDDSRGGSRD